MILSLLLRMTHSLAAMRRYFLIICLVGAAACGQIAEQLGDQFAGGVGSGGTGGGEISIGFGAPLVKSVITVKNAQGTTLAQAISDEQGAVSIQLPTNTSYPLLVQARVSSVVAKMDSFHALVFNAEQAKQINLNQISELIAALTLGQAPETVFNQMSIMGRLADVQTTYQRRTDQLQTALQSLFNAKKNLLAKVANGAKGAEYTVVQDLLRKKFNHDNTGLDAILDDLRLQKVGGDYQLDILADASIPALKWPLSAGVDQPLALPVDYVAKVNAASQRGVLAEMPVTVALSTPAVWGSINDSWAGYTGAMALYTPYELPANWELSFESDTLKADSFWNARLIRKEDIINPDGSRAQRFTLAGDGDAVKPAGAVFSVGFSGAGVLNHQVIFRHCQINHRACAVRFTGGEQNSVANLFSAFNRSDTVSNSMVQSITHTAKAPEVTLEKRSESEGGYGLTITVKNVSGDTLQGGSTGWYVVLPLKNGVLGENPSNSLWNFDARFSALAGGYPDGGYVMTPKSTAGPLSQNASVVSDFNGSGAITQLIPSAALPANIKYGCLLQKRLHELENTFVVDASCLP